jgi:hypothetical protein
MPSNLRIQAIKQLNESKSLIVKSLNNKSNKSDDLITCLNCFFSCGLVYIINYRFSLKTDTTNNNMITESTNLIHDPISYQDLNDFLYELNVNFKLNEKINKEINCPSDFKLLFYLVRIHILLSKQLKNNFIQKIFRINCKSSMFMHLT